MYIERVQSDEQRSFICKTAPECLPRLDKFHELRMAPLVLEDLRRDSEPFLSRYEIVKIKTSLLRRLVVEKNEIMEALMMYVRHARQVLEKRVARKEIDKDDLTSYGWRAGPGWGKSSSHLNWINGAFALIKGDAYVVKEGGKPLVEPAAFEIQALAKRAFKLRDQGLVLEYELRKLEELQKPLRRELDLQIRHLKSLIIRETRNDRGIWKILLRAAGYQIRYHTQEKEPEFGPDGEPIKPPKRRKLSPFQRKYKKPRDAEDKVAVLLKEARQKFEGTEPTAETPEPQQERALQAPELAPQGDLRYDPSTTKQTYRSPKPAEEAPSRLTQADKDALAEDAAAFRQAYTRSSPPPDTTVDSLPISDERLAKWLAADTSLHKAEETAAAQPPAKTAPKAARSGPPRKPLTATEKEKKKAKRKQEKQSRRRNR